MQDVTIDYNEWLYGKWARAYYDGSKTHYGSYLIRESDNRKCCLGIIGLACGVPRELMVQRTCPAAILDLNKGVTLPPVLAGLAEYTNPDWNDENGYHSNTGQASCIMNTNDNRSLSHAEREAQLTQLLRQIGINPIFVNRPEQEPQ